MHYEWRPYVSVAKRRANAQKAMAVRAKKGLRVDPVAATGRKIATTYWGIRWCEAMEADADIENRIPRGRTYVRNGSVVHLEISRGEVKAVVSGSELYDVSVKVKELSAARKTALRAACGEGWGALRNQREHDERHVCEDRGHDGNPGHRERCEVQRCRSPLA